MSFKAGDRVLINGQIATITVLDVDANQLVFETTPDGGGVNTTYAHVSNSRIEPLAGEVYDIDQPELPIEAEAAEGQGASELPIEDAVATEALTADAVQASKK